jgi:hypothetical protein
VVEKDATYDLFEWPTPVVAKKEVYRKQKEAIS